MAEHEGNLLAFAQVGEPVPREHALATHYQVLAIRLDRVQELVGETKKAPGITADAKEVGIEGWCQGGILKVEKGRVAIFGEATMFTAQLAGAKQQPIRMNHPDAKQNYQLLLNVMHWLTRAKGMPD